ncbi:MAG: TolC family protein [Gemmatimonadota bacterium]|jgi:outer membrane protein TolC
MRRMRILSAITLASCAALVLSPRISAQEEPEPYAIGRALPPLPADGSLLEMTLEEAIARALEMNLDIQSARLNPDIQRNSLFAARAAFAPTVSTTIGQNNSSQQSTSQLDGGTRISTDRLTFNGSLSKTLPWYGGRLSANFNNSRTETDNSFSTLNPSYRSSLNFSFSQPLLSGLKIDNQRNTLRTQEIQLDITDVQLEGQVENLTNQVRTAYWALRSAIENIEIQRRSLAQAQELLQQNQIRVELGTMSELQVVQAESQVASAEQSLLNAEVQWRNQELNFKRLLLGGADDPFLYQTLNPTSLPTLEQITVDIPAAIERALAQRTDIRQQRRQQEISELNLEVTEDNLKPSLDLSASYSVSGVGGDRYERGELGGDPVLIAEGGYRDGLEAIWDRDTPTWNLSLNFSYPIGNGAAKANLERARLQMRQTELSLKNQELAIVTQVTDAGLAVSDTYLQYQAAQRSREVAERSAEIEQTRFNVGASTNYEVTQAQDDLRAARLSELRAIINYVNAIAEFERVQRVGG